MLLTKDIQQILCKRYRINAAEAMKFISVERECAKMSGVRKFTFKDVEAFNTWLDEMEELGK